MKIRFSLVLALSIGTSLSAYIDTNITPVYRLNRETFRLSGAKLSFSSRCAYAISKRAWNRDAEEVDIFKMFEETQSSIPAFFGALPGSGAYNFANGIGIYSNPALDDGTRGHFDVSGDVSLLSFSLFGSIKVPYWKAAGRLSFYAAVPFIKMKYGSVVWNDLTKYSTAEDKNIKDNLTNSIADVMWKYGDLHIDDRGYEKSEIGEVVLGFAWENDLPQDKEFLKNVMIGVNAGVLIPAMSSPDVDHSFGRSVWHDGAWGIPLGAQLELGFSGNAFLEGQFDLLILFKHEDSFRMKTFPDQTSLLLMNKGLAMKVFSKQWQFTLVGGMREIGKYGHFSAYYSYREHGDDELKPKETRFVGFIVNSDRELSQAYRHEVGLSIGLHYPEVLRKEPADGKKEKSAKVFGRKIGFSGDIFISMPFAGQFTYKGVKLGGLLTLYA